MRFWPAARWIWCALFDASDGGRNFVGAEACSPLRAAGMPPENARVLGLRACRRMAGIGLPDRRGYRPDLPIRGNRRVVGFLKVRYRRTVPPRWRVGSLRGAATRVDSHGRRAGGMVPEAHGGDGYRRKRRGPTAVDGANSCAVDGHKKRQTAAARAIYAAVVAVVATAASW